MALALGTAGWTAATAHADPSPFNTLSCSCEETAPADSAALTDKIDRGIQHGLADQATMQIHH